MTVVKFGWKGELTKEQNACLNDVFNVMGLHAAADCGLIPQEEVDKEIALLNKKYPEVS